MNKYSPKDRKIIFDAVERVHKVDADEYEKLCTIIEEYADRGFVLYDVVKIVESWARGLEAEK